MSMSPSSPYATEDEPVSAKPASKKRKIASSKKSGKKLSSANMSDGGYADIGSTVVVANRTSLRGSKRTGDKTLPGLSSPQKSQVTKFLDRAGSPLIQILSDSDQEAKSSNNQSSSSKSVKVELSSDSE